LVRWTYWGLPLLPTLLVRNVLVNSKKSEQEICNTGFHSRSATLNAMLGALAGCEFIPQHVAGTSLMALFEHRPPRNSNAGS
jgi:hypothetical protein